jgi:hypothetical protein
LGTRPRPDAGGLQLSSNSPVRPLCRSLRISRPASSCHAPCNQAPAHSRSKAAARRARTQASIPNAYQDGKA